MLPGLVLLCPALAFAGTSAWQLPETLSGARASVVMLTAANGLAGRVGSGVVVDARGLVLTADHVASRGPALQVRVGDAVLPAHTVTRDPAVDLHLLYVPGLERRATRIAQRDDLRPGHEVWLIAGGGDIRAGRVLSAARSLPAVLPEVSLVVCDVSAEPGESGGGLFDRRGRLRGMLLAVRGAQDGARSASIPVGDIRAFLAAYYSRRGTGDQVVIGDE